MEIDALRQGSRQTRWDWLRFMKGKCYGCAGTDHTKKDCKRLNPNALCSYCQRAGHMQDACTDKFLGQPRGRGLNRPPQPRQQQTGSFQYQQQPVGINAANTNPEPEDKGAELARKMDELTLKMKEINAQRLVLEKEMADFV